MGDEEPRKLVDGVSPACERCRFWQFFVATGDERFGLCKRRAPPTIDGHPHTEHADWCGEFEPCKTKGND